MLNHVGTQQLETDRLILRRHKMTDADDMYRNWVTDPEVCRFWQWKPHKNIDETKALLAGWIDSPFQSLTLSVRVDNIFPASMVMPCVFCW